MKKKMAKTLAVLMCLMTAVAFMPTFAFAAEAEEPAEPAAGQQVEPAEEQQETSNEQSMEVQETSNEQSMEVQETTEPAEDANVKITVSNQGVLAADKNGKVMAYRDVVASDIDKDGRITVDEALVAAHNSYLAGGAAENYDNGGGFCKYAWGTSCEGIMFFVNDKGIANGILTDTVNDGDDLYMGLMSDLTGWSDYYTAFYETTENPYNGERIKSLRLARNEGHWIALKGSSAAWTYPPAEPSEELAGVKIGTWENGEFKDTGIRTETDGWANIKFAEAGTYYVTAYGTIWDYHQDTPVDLGKPVMAPVIKVTVYDDNSVSLAEAKADAVKTLSESYNINDYRGFVQMNVLTKVLAGIAEINAAETPEKVGAALGKAMKAIGEIKTDAQMTKEENAVRAIGISSFSAKAGKKSATVKWAKNSTFSGYQIYYKQAKKSAKYTTATAASKTIKKLAKGKKITFKVRGYKVMNGKTVYGKWSASKTVKIK